MDKGIQVFFDVFEAVPVVRVIGEIDLATAPELGARLSEIPTGSSTVIIDMSEVSFLDSTGLSVLVTSWKRFCERDENASFRLVVTRPAINRVLEVTGLAHVFGVFATLEEAAKG
jgi:anti-sigma B factor antagonist